MLVVMLVIGLRAANYIKLVSHGYILGYKVSFRDQLESYWILTSRRGASSMKPQPEIGDTQLFGEENKLAELERQKTIIETENHRGFGDAIRLIQLKGKLEALEKNIMHGKQRTKDNRGG
jgi:hypothetical protein